MSTLIALVAAEGRAALKRLPEEASLEDRFRAAMAACRNHWMVTDEDRQMMGACEAVYASASEDERERIEGELRSLATLSAALNGVTVDLELVELVQDPIGILGLWRASVTP